MSLGGVLEAERLRCFKNYDVRGRVGRDLDEDVAYRIGRGVAEVLSPQSVVIGRDCRLSGRALSAAFADGLVSSGANVFDIGLAGTEEVYHAVSHLYADVGVIVTASHNPADENGFKLIGRAGRPLTRQEFADVRACSERTSPRRLRGSGRRIAVNTRAAYASYLLQLVDVGALPNVRLVSNAGNGVAGPAFDAIVEGLNQRGVRLEVERLLHAPNGHFPRGVPNPMIPERRAETAEAVCGERAALGIAWDGDFDRCFFFDERGHFIDGAHMAALLGGLFAAPGETVLHDARVVWPMTGAVANCGGTTQLARTGHVHMKRTMRETGAIYGGEMSGHHYFRDFMACDTGMLPWLKVLEALGREQATISELAEDVVTSHPVSGELNFRAENVDRVKTAISDRYSPGAIDVDRFDGLSVTFSDWRFNLRSSLTEPLLRLNIETRGDSALLSESRDAMIRVLVNELGCVAQAESKLQNSLLPA